MSAIETLRDALFGNPPSATLEPSREGVLAAFTELYGQAVVAMYAAQAGIISLGTIAERDTFYANEANRGKLVYVNNNNDSDTDPLNGVYEFADGVARPALSFYQGVALVVQPLVDDAEAAAATAETAADEAVAARVAMDERVITRAGSLLRLGDGQGNLVIDISAPTKIDEEGQLTTGRLRIGFHPGWNFVIADNDGNFILAVDLQGRLLANFTLAAPPPLTDGTYDYSVNHLFCYGQSLSVGQALPIQSGTAAYDHLMFNSGMRPQYDYPGDEANWYDSLVPAIEIVSPNPSWPALGETPCRGTADGVKERILAEDGKAYTDQEYRLMLSAPGYGGLTIAELSKGSVHFTRMVTQAGEALTLANAGGETYAVQAVTWIQGESDYQSSTSYATYLASLNTLIADIQTDLKAESGQAKDIAVIGAQIASHIHGATDDVPDIALAQLACSIANADFHLACPMYHFAYADGFHLTGPSSRWLGGYLGLAYKRIVIDGGEWSPVRPISSVVQANVAELRFHVPTGRLVFDTAGVAAQTSMGFRLVESDGDPLTISSVEIIDFDRVRIIASAPIPVGAKVRYAWTGDTARGLGNLRDTQGETIIFDPAGIAAPLHNWCVIFEQEL